MSRFDIVTGRESNEPQKQEDSQETKQPQFLADYSLNIASNPPSYGVSPGVYIPFEIPNLVRVFLPSGLQIAGPVRDVSVVTSSSDTFLQIRIPRNSADQILNEIRSTSDPNDYANTAWEQAHQRASRRAIDPRTFESPATRAARMNHVTNMNTTLRIQPSQPGELTEDQMRNILNEPL